MTRFCPLVSGSSGNSVFVETEGTRILVDAGVSGKKIEECLKDIDVGCESIDALFITHEHSDHIKAAGIISRRYDIPLYATEGTWNAMEPFIGSVSRKNRKIIYSGERTELNDMVIKPFSIPHDAAEPVGYNIFSDNIKMTIEMLKRGPYPYNLKQRILGLYGHMANASAGELLKEVFSGRMRHIFLGHLSKENNTPELAYKTVENILFENHINVGRDVKLELARRNSVSPAVQF